MPTLLRTIRSLAAGPLLLVVGLPATAEASPQDPSTSLDRIREGLARTPSARLKLDLPVPAAPPVFKSRVDQRVYVLTLEQWLAKEFNLTDLQRQSAEWRSRCCGINLGALMTSVESALERRKVRQVREQIARELVELEAARRQAGLPDQR